MESADGGATWVKPRAIDPEPFESIVLAGPVLKLANGSLALECEAWKSYHDTSRGEHHAALWISADGGRTFDGPVVVAHDPAGDLLFWDERMGVNPRTGRIIALFWTHNRSVGRDVNVHVAWGSPDGKEWTAPQDAGFAGQIAFPPVLPDGRVLACYVHRHDCPACARCSAPILARLGTRPTSSCSITRIRRKQARRASGHSASIGLT
jgi:hypothetical protein